MNALYPMNGALALVPFDAPEPFEIIAGEDVATLLARLLDAGRLTPDQIPFLAIWLNGEELERDTALDWVLVHGDQVALVLVPQGGGEGKKDVGAILLNLAVLVVSLMTGNIPMAITAGIAYTRALFTRIPDKSKAANESYALGGQSNNVRLDQPMPLVLGLQTVYPDVAAQPYTQTVGDTVYLHVVYGLHYGPCAVSDIKIGGTELAQYGADVETEVVTAAGAKSSLLYPSRVVQNSLTDTIDEAGGWEAATSAVDAEALEVDLVWPGGLYRVSSSQVQKSLGITITIERRLVGAPSWTAWVNETITMNTKDAVRRTWATAVPKGQYEVRLRRTVPPPANSGQIVDTVVWTALRTIENAPAVSDPNLSLLFCRFKASKELSGTLPVVSAVVEPIAEIWTGSAWGSAQATSNPAALVRMLAMGPNAALPISASEVGASLATFYTHCATNDFRSGVQVLGDTSLGDAMQAVAACGHGAIWHDGSQIQCALEWTKSSAKALFDWRTASNWREEREWLGEIHGMRIAFRDSSNNGAGAEVLVYADGYSSANASLFERVDVDRSMSPARAWREGRKALVRRINGGRSVSFRTPADGLDMSAVQFGARVAIVPPLLSLARASAGVENRIMAGGLVAGVRLDDDVEIVTGTTHGLRIGTPLRGVLAVQVAAAGGAIGWTRDLYFTSPMAPNDAPEAGDKVVFGILGSEAQDYEIAGLRPLSSFDVEVTVTPYLGPLIAAVEGETPPAGLQGALNTANSPLPAPRIDAATPNGEGGALVVFALLPQRGNPIDAVTVRRRVQLAADGTDAAIWGQWEDLPSLSGSARMVTIPPPNMAAGGVAAQSRALAMEIQLAAVSRAATSLPATASVTLTRQLIPEVAAQATSVPWDGVTGGGKPEDNATIGGRVGVNIFPGSGSTPLPGAELLNSANGIGGNMVVNSDLTFDTTGFFNAGFTNMGGSGFAIEGARNAGGYFGHANSVYTRALTTSGSLSGSYLFGWPQRGFDGNLSDLRRYALPVKFGDQVWAAARISVHSMLDAVCRVRFWAKDGTFVAEYDARVENVDARLGGPSGADGNPANYSLVGSMWAVPANSAFAVICPYGDDLRAGQPDCYVFATQYHLTRVPAGQTVAPPYVPGPSERRADVTGEKTAAAITGQGALATKNTINLGDVQSGTQPNNATLNETSTGTITLTTSWSTISDTTVTAWKGGLADVRWMFTGFISASQTWIALPSPFPAPKLILARLLIDNVAVGPEIIAGVLGIRYEGNTDYAEELNAPIQAIFQEAATAGSNRNFKVQLRVSRDSLGLGPSRPGRMSVRECML